MEPAAELSPEQRKSLMWVGSAIKDGWPPVFVLESLLRRRPIVVSDDRRLCLTDSGDRLYHEIITAQLPDSARKA